MARKRSCSTFFATAVVVATAYVASLAGCGAPIPAPSQNDTKAAPVERGPAATSGEVYDSQRPTNDTRSRESEALAVFQRRILPIFQAQRPSSCTECHLGGVELRYYIGPDQQKTYARLVAAGLVDVEKPAKSKILTFIARKPEKPNLITDKVRQEEYEAFSAWLEAAARDPSLREAKADEQAVGPEVPAEVIRHSRQDRVLASFVDNIWTEIGRCAACHSPDRNQKQVREHGEQVSWIKLGDPAATMQYMLEAGLIDADQPASSLLVRKPTQQVEHGGGQKMVVGDRSYKQFRRFLDDYAATAAGKYRTAEALPQPAEESSVVSEIWLKLTDVPERYNGTLLQVDLYRWEDAPQGGWSKARWATSDRPVFGKGRLWQHSLSLIAPAGSQRDQENRRQQQLPPGKYLARIYVDTDGKLAKDYRAELGPEDLVGEVEIDSRWPAGYGQMTVARFVAGGVRAD